jgi:long-chain-fatty-acid--CoA ligase ACSBG
LYRGRGSFKGYFKNEAETRKTIDGEGFVKSGDIGKLENNILTITGRSKELIITAGGENVAPVLIENEVKSEFSIYFSFKIYFFPSS